MGLTRGCSKTGCRRPAVATLTYGYADRAVVLGPLATYAEPHTYDLCLDHAERMTAPRGWDVVRVGGEFSEPVLATDDLLALADAVRDPGPVRGGPSAPGAPEGGPWRRRVVSSDPPPGARGQAGVDAESAVVEAGRRGHLRILRDGAGPS